MLLLTLVLSEIIVCMAIAVALVAIATVVLVRDIDQLVQARPGSRSR